MALDFNLDWINFLYILHMLIFSKHCSMYIDEEALLNLIFEGIDRSNLSRRNWNKLYTRCDMMYMEHVDIRKV